MEKEIDIRSSFRKNVNKEHIVDVLEKAIAQNDYMALVSLQLRIKTGYYEEWKPEDAEKDIKFLDSYKRSYPHIASEIDEVQDYLNGLVVARKIEGN